MYKFEISCDRSNCHDSAVPGVSLLRGTSHTALFEEVYLGVGTTGPGLAPAKLVRAT
jgi:hypothetical protein